MAIKIVLIGGLRDNITPAELLGRLCQTPVTVSVVWEWVHAPGPNWQPQQKQMNRLLDQLRKWLSAKEKYDPNLDPKELIVVKLFDLHGRASNDLFRVWKEPKLVPDGIVRADELTEWLLSPEAGLLPPAHWLAGPSGAALVAILSKLIKNKSWNGSVAGHNWTKEVDLLTQSPVNRNDAPEVANEAKRMLDSLSQSLLLTKGASQGRTPKEWSINLQFLPYIKRAITRRSFAPLEDVQALEALLTRIAGEPANIELIGEIVNERVLYFCQGQDE
jgi:hypothetical protein